MARVVAQLRQEPVAGVFVDAAQLAAVHWIGILLQADEILEAIADGVAIIGPDRQVFWANPEFLQVTGHHVGALGLRIEDALGTSYPVCTDTDPFAQATTSRRPAEMTVRVQENRYLRVTATPVFDTAGALTHQIILTRDITAEVLQEQKINAIHRAGEELADLTPEELAELTADERKDLLKLNIIRHVKDLFGLDFIEIHLLEPETGRLVPLLAEGMIALASKRALFARERDNGVTGFVAATGSSYLCRDTASDPLYLEGAAAAHAP